MRLALALSRTASVAVGVALAAIPAAAWAAGAASNAPHPYCAQEVPAEELSRMNVAKQRYLGDRPEDGDPFKRSMSTTLPDGATRVEVEDRTLRIIDPSGAVVEAHPLFSGYDVKGWSAFHALPGDWLYVRGAQFDSALRIEWRDGRWTLTQNIRIRGRSEGVLDAGLRWLLGMDGRQVSGDRLDSLVAKGGFRFHSPVLRSVLFLEDGEKFERGRFVPFGRWPRPMRWYYGDLPAEKVALLRDFDGNVYSYDGRTLAPVGGPRLAYGSASQPLPGSRTFLGSGWKVFEVRGAGHERLRLVELRPADGRAVGWFVAVVLGGGELLLVGRHAVYEPVGDELRPVWKPDGEAIGGPMNADRLADGKLVIATEGSDGRAVGRIRLLAPCHGR